MLCSDEYVGLSDFATTKASQLGGGFRLRLGTFIVIDGRDKDCSIIDGVELKKVRVELKELV
jgi:hypothetical protein